MSLTEQINEDIKSAMREKNKPKLEALRAIKSQLLLAATEKGGKESSEEVEVRMLQKLVKQRKESADIYSKEGREELANEELEQISFIEKYLPEQLSEGEIRSIIESIIAETGASSMQDMGKVMGMANQKMAGKADGSMIAQIVKSSLQ